MEKARAGNHHAFRMLVEMYRDDVYRIVYGILRNQKDAEDAAQEVFIKIYKSLPNYKNQGFKTWISRIAVNHCIDMKRKAYRKREEITDAIPEKMSNQNPTERRVIERELREQIYEKINKLPGNYRDVVYGYYIQGKTFEQLAEEQNVKKKTIEVRLYRARVWMKKHWKEEEFQ
ncbi:RNA polymerase sigma factor [Fervidibacillus halotolerans]|uniref:Sigma-70 family RNA polymerase sigma factor n=1 Tax=Fervidibacillus halotolerans TaxID=2980027 RepID=A0A9E8M034_9BACI|nr:sigma-70 family RNA polymerase sigma factor [Fervidibacillus halotolerans]WAA12882.1 sigma-70 family RNA polymerase sigma factor [Fervidibacillus halotolerans]